MDKEIVEKVLGRPIYKDVVDQIMQTAPFYKGHRILITGASGSIGQELYKVLNDGNRYDIDLIGIDIDPHNELIYQLDITSKTAISDLTMICLEEWRDMPTIIFHLAAAKHAPAGELFRTSTWTTNIIGTQNIINAFPSSQLILASTCKACDPETVYGASKLIAEREVLGAGGSVARFYNTVETQGNVFEIWKEHLNIAGITKSSPRIKVAHSCNRYFMSIEEAVGLLLSTPFMPAGRWTIGPMIQRSMTDIADDLYPNAEKVAMPPRRGDRIAEPLHAKSEELIHYISNFYKIVNKHDTDV